MKRTKGVGVLPPSVAQDYGVTGPSLRGSGINYDLRKAKPYSVYQRLKFDVPVGSGPGDTWDRYMCRIKEMRLSNEIIKQCLRDIPGGTSEQLRELRQACNSCGKDDCPHCGGDLRIMVKKQNAGLRIKAGEGFAAVESPRGVLGCYVISNGSDTPYRFKWRNPSFSNLAVLPVLLADRPISDIMAIFGSIDVILPDVDR